MHWKLYTVSQLRHIIKTAVCNIYLWYVGVHDTILYQYFLYSDKSQCIVNWQKRRGIWLYIFLYLWTEFTGNIYVCRVFGCLESISLLFSCKQRLINIVVSVAIEATTTCKVQYICCQELMETQRYWHNTRHNADNM